MHFNFVMPVYRSILIEEEKYFFFKALRNITLFLPNHLIRSVVFAIVSTTKRGEEKKKKKECTIFHYLYSPPPTIIKTICVKITIIDIRHS